MTFAAKYEIEKAIAGGRVETFLARRIAQGDTVLVHIFECPEKQANQPTIDWVQQSFHAIAPKPAEPILEVGAYSGNTYAYLVTRLPEREILEKWLQRYELGHCESENPTPEMESAVAGAQPETTDEQDGDEGEEPAPGSITEAFEALRMGLGARVERSPDGGMIIADDRAGAEEATEPEPKVPERPTDFFSKMAAESNPERHYRAAPGTGEPVAPPPSPMTHPDPEPQSDNTGFYTAVFNDVKKPEPRPSGSTLSTGTEGTVAEHNSSANGLKPGEFTNFYGGPFGADKPQVTSEISQRQPRSAAPPGEFTQVFGPAEPGEAEHRPSEPPSPASLKGERGSISGIFRDLEREVAQAGDSNLDRIENQQAPNNIRVRRYPAQRTDTASGMLAEASPHTAVFPSGEQARTHLPPVSDAGVLLDSPGVRPPLADAAEANKTGALDATKVLTPSERLPHPDLSDLPASPSAYTQVVAGGRRRSVHAPGADENGDSTDPLPPSLEGGDAGGSMGSAAAAKVQPYIPSPQIPPATIPQPAGLPHPQTPPVPSYSAPSPASLPKAGAMDAQVGGKIPWAMILILNGIFVLAVLLVLFFALRR